MLEEKQVTPHVVLRPRGVQLKARIAHTLDDAKFAETRDFDLVIRMLPADDNSARSAVMDPFKH